jgi:putative SOS response-associated peptidase YedK
MCNRFALSKKDERLVVAEYGSVELYYQLRWNIAPTQPAPVVFLENGKLVCRDMQWGFKPAWSKSPITNAMRETLEQKATFKDAFAMRRCLVPATGFYEWCDFNKGRQPVLFSLPDDHLFYFGGLWSTKEPPGHFVIVTTAANESVRGVHNRMPLIVPPTEYQAWLSPEGEAYKQIGAFSGELKTVWVDHRVNFVKNDGPESAQPLTATVKTLFGGYNLPEGLPELAAVKITGFHEGTFVVDFEGKRFEVDSACVHRHGW